MESQVLYKPVITARQREADAAHRKFYPGSKTEFPVRVAQAPTPVEVLVEAVQPPIPNEMFDQAWAQLKGRLNHRGEVRLDAIKKAACEHFGISHTEMVSARRTLVIVRPRQIAMWVCKEITTRSYPEIGRMFGGRDHTTALYGVRLIEKMRRRDPHIQSDIDALCECLTGKPAERRP